MSPGRISSSPSSNVEQARMQRQSKLASERKLLELLRTLSLKTPLAVTDAKEARHDVTRFFRQFGESDAVSSAVRELYLTHADSPEVAQALEGPWLSKNLGAAALSRILSRQPHEWTQGRVERLWRMIEANQTITPTELSSLTDCLIRSSGGMSDAVRETWALRALKHLANAAQRYIRPSQLEAANLWRLAQVVGQAHELREALGTVSPEGASLLALVDGAADEAFRVKELLGKATADQLRRLFETSPSATQADIRSFIEGRLRVRPSLTAGDVRVIAARMDADYQRTTEEQSALETLSSTAMTAEAVPLYERLLKGVSRSHELWPPLPEPSGTRSWVWEDTGRIVSDGRVREEDLKETRLENGRLVHPLFTLEISKPASALNQVTGWLPDPDGDGVTDERFDAVNAAYQLERALKKIERTGFRPEQLLPPHSPVHLHDTTTLNAGADPLRFGTANRAWNMVEDGHTLLHELGHMVLYGLAPGLNKSQLIAGKEEALAFHEGFGDIVAALVSGHPTMDAAVEFLDDPTVGRDANNRLDLNALNPSEFHKRGQVYSGLAWDLRRAFQLGGATAEQSRRLTLEVVLNTGASLATYHLTPADIFVAFEAALERVITHHPDLGSQRGVLHEALETSAIRRGLLDNGLEDARRRVTDGRLLAQSLNLNLCPPTPEGLAEELAAHVGRPGAFLPATGFTLAGPSWPKAYSLPGGGSRVVVRSSDTQQGPMGETAHHVLADFDGQGRLVFLSPLTA